MCRIFGSFGNKAATAETLLSVSEAQLRGGPDAQTLARGTGWALGNNRLAIQGLGGGDQPFHGKKIAVVYNGEIYNHGELRRELEREGYNFDDQCDGAILPAMYERYGECFAEYLDGMFTIAVVDFRSTPKLLIATDPGGVKSIYYHWEVGTQTLYFASELAALFEFKEVPRRYRAAAIHQLLSLRSVWCPETSFDSVLTLPPESQLSLTLGMEPTVRSYATRVHADGVETSFTNNISTLRTLLQGEIERMLPTEVRGCLVVSGGLDSSLLSALAARNQAEPFDSFHLCYAGEWPADERVYAREVAATLGTRHHEIAVNPADLPELLEQTTAAIGQPNTAPHNLSTFALFEGIAKAGFKVAITGEGADEFFGGYQRFVDARQASGTEWTRQYLDKFGPFPWSIRDRLYSREYATFAQSSRTTPDQVEDTLAESSPGAKRFRTLLELDQRHRMPSYILRRVDHLSMAHAVEVRVPFCQPKVIDFSRRIDTAQMATGGRGKQILYDVASNLLPAAVLERKKQPFTLPIAAFLKRGQRIFGYAHDILTSRRFAERGFFNTTTVNAMFERQLSEGEAVALWCVLSLEVWLRSQESQGTQVVWQ